MSAQFVLHAAPAGVPFAQQPYGTSPYQRVFTLLSPEQLQLVLAKGWEALDSTPVFCSDAGICHTARYCSQARVNVFPVVWSKI
jgi:hypothetical protein